MYEELVKQVASLQKQVDALVKPEIGFYLIEERLLSAPSANETFSSIPQNFKHLKLISFARTDVAAEVDNILVQFNGDGGANYDSIRVQFSTGGTAISVSRAATSIILLVAEGANSRANNFASSEAMIFRYIGDTTEKHCQALSGVFGDVSADTDLLSLFRRGRWQNVNPITSITLTPGTGPNFIAGSRFQLFGFG
jgi:hypothetical protein